MQALGRYILHLVAAALLCAVAKAIAGKKGAAAGAVQLVSGAFLMVMLISPLLRLDFGDFSLERYTRQAEEAVDAGSFAAEETLRELIKSKTEAYILDKAQSFGGELTVEVSLDGSSLPVPCGVEISGKISPYGKTQLQSIIRDDLGIPTEAQIWNT